MFKNRNLKKIKTTFKNRYLIAVGHYQVSRPQYETPDGIHEIPKLRVRDRERVYSAVLVNRSICTFLSFSPISLWWHMSLGKYSNTLPTATSIR